MVEAGTGLLPPVGPMRAELLPLRVKDVGETLEVELMLPPVGPITTELLLPTGYVGELVVLVLLEDVEILVGYMTMVV